MTGSIADGTLHVTNGDLAADVIAAALDARVVPWRDVLHEGPLPAGLSDPRLRETRASFLAERGWTDRAAALAFLEARDAALDGAADAVEIVLWFEPDLYDQLQLLQVLDRLARPDLAGVPVTMVESVEAMGSLSDADARRLHVARRPLAAGARETGRRAWKGLRAPDPTGLEPLALEVGPALPYLPAALRRLLEELPAVGDGLSRSERQALEALSGGPRRAAEAFRAAHQDREERVFLGDVVFYSYLDRLAAGERPLVVLDSRPAGPETHASLGSAGPAVLAGELDWIDLGGSDRWLGGVHLAGGSVQWRWDRARSRVRPAKE